MLKVKDIAKAIEDFAPLSLKEDWDNPGLQVGDREMEVTGVLLCLDVTEEILKEARKLDCNMIVSHHPLIFGGLKRLTGATPTERIVADALRYSIAIYSAHTNLDSAFEGVSYEMAHMLGMKECRPLERNASGNEKEGLGIVGDVSPTPKLEFLRKVRDTFEVKDLRYSAQTPGIMVRKVALCGGSGGSLIRAALKSGADVYLCGDLKYHDFTSYGSEILLADIGHFESELCSRKILSRAIRSAHPDCVIYFSECERSPICIMHNP
ncbi:MAG: Nif3-like dinuclear metal center hexameric protein [Muribaculaceae bacterium]|nr:Nif3-like dinuclear metal center hexameric protein [Bacteroides sp.]MDE5846691.1 Nif3-like dinuclear metal center hexameric protein [Muribaculaceae bacterium]